MYLSSSPSVKIALSNFGPNRVKSKFSYCRLEKTILTKKKACSESEIHQKKGIVQANV